MATNKVSSTISHVASPHKRHGFHPCIQHRNMPIHEYLEESHLYLKQKKQNEWIKILLLVCNPNFLSCLHHQASPNENIKGLPFVHLGRQDILLLDTFWKMPQHHWHFAIFVNSWTTTLSEFLASKLH
jgi:hypothetical protein